MNHLRISRITTCMFMSSFLQSCTNRCFTAQASDRLSRLPFQEHLCNVMLRLTPQLLASAVRGTSQAVLDDSPEQSTLDVGCTAGAVQWFFTGLCSLCSDVPAATVITALKPLLTTIVTILEEKHQNTDSAETELRQAHELLSRR